jgi:signal transduction histidine kinase
VLLVASIFFILCIHQNRKIAFHEQLTYTQIEIQEETFQHISLEIHDNIGLSLTLAKLHLNTLDLNSKHESLIAIKSSVELISQAINDLSHISKNLNSEAIRGEGFIAALQMKLEKISKLKKFHVTFNIEGETFFMDAQSELILYRIAQEALNNIIKHAKASEIYVNLNYTPDQLLLAIADNGSGIKWRELEEKKSTKMPAGLNNMKKRAKMINGSCDIKSSETGTKVLITIPLQTNEERTNCKSRTCR